MFTKKQKADTPKAKPKPKPKAKKSKPFKQELLARKHETGRIPSNIKPVEYNPDAPVEKKRIYPNRAAHPEFQSIDLVAGATSALMKQHEINEELLRALIDIQIAGLSKVAKKEMMEKYKHLI